MVASISSFQIILLLPKACLADSWQHIYQIRGLEGMHKPFGVALALQHCDLYGKWMHISLLCPICNQYDLTDTLTSFEWQKWKCGNSFSHLYSYLFLLESLCNFPWIPCSFCLQLQQRIFRQAGWAILKSKYQYQIYAVTFLEVPDH